MRKPEDTPEYTGPGWDDLDKIVGRELLLAEFTRVRDGRKVYFRITNLGGARSRGGAFNLSCQPLRGKEVLLLGRCPKGFDQPGEYHNASTGHKR